MIVNKALHRIQTGDATAKEARRTLRDLFESEDHKAVEQLYAALRSWTWKALSTRRFDKEMEEWFELLQAASARSRPLDERTSHFFMALSDLVDESLRFAPTRQIDRLVTRSHIGDLLDIVRRHNGRIDRARLETESGLSPSRLSQLLTELVVFGALNRESDSRRAIFTLTDTGREVQERWADAQKRPRVEADPEPDEVFQVMTFDKDSEKSGHLTPAFVPYTRIRPIDDRAEMRGTVAGGGEKDGSEFAVFKDASDKRDLPLRWTRTKLNGRRGLGTDAKAEGPKVAIALTENQSDLQQTFHAFRAQHQGELDHA